MYWIQTMFFLVRRVFSKFARFYFFTIYFTYFFRIFCANTDMNANLRTKVRVQNHTYIMQIYCRIENCIWERRTTKWLLAHEMNESKLKKMTCELHDMIIWFLNHFLETSLYKHLCLFVLFVYLVIKSWNFRKIHFDNVEVMNDFKWSYSKSRKNLN